MINKAEKKITEAFKDMVDEYNSRQEYEQECIGFRLDGDKYEFKIPNLPNDPRLEIIPCEEIEKYLNSLDDCEGLDCMSVSEIKEVLKPQFTRELL